MCSNIIYLAKSKYLLVKSCKILSSYIPAALYFNIKLTCRYKSVCQFLFTISGKGSNRFRFIRYTRFLRYTRYSRIGLFDTFLWKKHLLLDCAKVFSRVPDNLSQNFHGYKLAQYHLTQCRCIPANVWF